MDFIFSGKFGVKKKAEIRKLVFDTIKKLVDTEELGKHNLECYNIAFIQADIKNAQNEDIIFLDLRADISGHARGELIEKFLFNGNCMVTASENKHI